MNCQSMSAAPLSQLIRYLCVILIAFRNMGELLYFLLLPISAKEYSTVLQKFNDELKGIAKPELISGPT